MFKNMQTFYQKKDTKLSNKSLLNPMTIEKNCPAYFLVNEQTERFIVKEWANGIDQLIKEGDPVLIYKRFELSKDER